MLYQRMAAMRQFPRSMIPIIEWGQHSPALPDGFRTAAEIFGKRAVSQGSVLAVVLLPVMLLLIPCFRGDIHHRHVLAVNWSD